MSEPQHIGRAPYNTLTGLEAERSPTPDITESISLSRREFRGFLEVGRCQQSIQMEVDIDGFADMTIEQAGELIDALTRLKAEAEQWRRENQAATVTDEEALAIAEEMREAFPGDDCSAVEY